MNSVPVLQKSSVTASLNRTSVFDRIVFPRVSAFERLSWPKQSTQSDQAKKLRRSATMKHLQGSDFSDKQHRVVPEGSVVQDHSESKPLNLDLNLGPSKVMAGNSL